MRTALLGVAMFLSAGAASATTLSYRFVQTGAIAGPFEEWTRKATGRIVIDAEVGVHYEILHYIDADGFIDFRFIPTSSNPRPAP